MLVTATSTACDVVVKTRFSRRRPLPQNVDLLERFPLPVRSTTAMHDANVTSSPPGNSMMLRVIRWYSAARRDHGQAGEPAALGPPLRAK